MRSVEKRDAKPVGVIDAETDPFEYGVIPEPFIWGFKDSYRYKTFTDTDALIDWLADQDMIVYAHNGGKFDYHLKGFLKRLSPFQEIMMINGRLSTFKIGKCEFRDSVNILPCKLDELGIKHDMDYQKLRKENRMRHMPEIMRYLKQDCDTLYEAVSNFIRLYGLNLTLASAAMKQWRKIADMPSPRNGNQSLFTYMQPWYYGGRVECFHKGMIRESFKLADIKSAYPFAMLHDHPYGQGYGVELNPQPGPVDPQAFYELTVDHDGCFPVRTANGLSFAPAKRQRVWATGWELKAAQDTGAATVLRIHQQVTFGASINFRSYVDHFYAIKEAAPKNSFERLAAKLFLNSLYGKFGSNPLEYHSYMVLELSDWEEAQEDGWQLAAEVGPWAIVKRPLAGAELGFYNLATAASVTGFVRAYLWRAINAVSRTGGRVLYCDTDSLAFIPGGSDPLTYGKALGDWEDEGAFSGGGIAGKKMYAFQKASGGYKIACKGVKLSADEILEVASGNTVTYRREAPSFSVKHGAKFITRQVKRTT